MCSSRWLLGSFLSVPGFRWRSKLSTLYRGVDCWGSRMQLQGGRGEGVREGGRGVREGEG